MIFATGEDAEQIHELYPDQDNDDDTIALLPWKLIGIVVGIVLVLGIALFFLRRKQKKD